MKYLENKKKFQSKVKDVVFSETDYFDGKKTSLIKEIFTAMCFGANLSSNSWYEHGDLKTGSINKILENDDLLNKFMNYQEVIGFHSEQNEITKLIIEDAISKNKLSINDKGFLKNSNRGRNNNKYISFLYQHAETAMMNIVREELSKINIQVLANIHDAITIRNKLSKYEKSEIERKVNEKLNYKYFSLGEKRINSVKII